MPYIKQELRGPLRKSLIALEAGELNFLITDLCNRYLISKHESYATYNTVIGALECAKLEMYRRQVAEYEDRKKEENGDVYPSY